MAASVRLVTVGADDDGQRIDNFLMRALPGVPRSHVYKLLRSGQVRVDGGRARPDRRLRAGEQVRIPPVRVAERPATRRAPDALLARLAAAVIHEDEDYLALDKPAGLAVHGGSGVPFGLIEALRTLYAGDRRLELCHRLDRDTSGVLLVARTRRALLRAHAALRKGAAVKHYAAILHGVLPRARRVEAALRIRRPVAGERRTMPDADGRPARSDFEPLSVQGRATLTRVRIHTGRMHQIRAHAAAIGYPVAGDRRYGSRELDAPLRAAGLRRLFLHAESLELPAADGLPALCLQAEPPDEFAQAMAVLAAADGDAGQDPS